PRRRIMSLPNRSLAATGSPLVCHDSGESQGVDWLTMHHGAGPGYHPCFSERLLHEIKRVQETIRNRVAANPDPKAGVHHLVLASDAPVFNLGGALALFSKLIRAGDRGRMLDYARLCVEVAYNFSQL